MGVRYSAIADIVQATPPIWIVRGEAGIVVAGPEISPGSVETCDSAAVLWTGGRITPTAVVNLLAADLS